MKLKKHLTCSNVLFTASFLFAAGVLLKNYLDGLNVPPGVCPVQNNRGLMTIAIIILIVVTIVTSILDYKKKKE